MLHYLFGGLSIASQVSLLGLRPLADGAGAGLSPVAYSLGAGSRPRGQRHLYRWAGGYGLSLWTNGDDWLFDTPTHGCVVVGRDGSRITGFPEADAPPAAFFNLLVGRVLPRVAVLHGALGLHSAAVASRGQALLLLGDSGAGKSTLSAALALRHGWTLLTDDAAVVDRLTLAVWPGAGGAALWPDSRRALAMSDERGHPMPRDAAKLWIEEASQPPAGPCPIRSLIFLNRRSEFEEASLCRLAGFETMVRTAYQLVRFHPADRKAAPHLVQRLSHLANGVAGFRLDYPSDYAAIPAVAALLEDCLEQAAAA